ncbi:hypothetical protein SARC_06528 [Sphaeroforma arctica JP610]|uniref:DDE Tnp4 domain-containing protein n=1 Tax=Sphaeroforma arctica JP610 TaxID=667725 RepID=A0A0L0FWX8_9EUKA|nr:hypothetical protein SARC_06528 [Sphaeroforma arctica JP610]KNC81129.1 hypothetical protein SARC_06528 [Sphaeroforma arctica JP610]|eukprot:XP_014155031.1 hypothetical protein SARC_06528 [Sphaeroforma arctica JP610]
MSNTFVTVDGIDCNVPESHPFRASLMSHKTRHAAYKYELVISIRAGDICFVNGGGVEAETADITLSRDFLVYVLVVGEKIVADKGYEDGFEYFPTPLEATVENAAANAMMKRWRARHETANGRMRSFYILKSPFRASRLKHSIYFMAVAIIVQLSIRSGHSLFDKR